MQIIEMDKLEGHKNKRGVVAKPILKHDNAQVMNLVLEPGDKVPEHSVPVDVFFYIVEGKGTIKIGDEEAIVQERDIITCEPNTKMALRADQGEKFVFLNVKTPAL